MCPAWPWPPILCALRPFAGGFQSCAIVVRLRFVYPTDLCWSSKSGTFQVDATAVVVRTAGRRDKHLCPPVSDQFSKKAKLLSEAIDFLAERWKDLVVLSPPGKKMERPAPVSKALSWERSQRVSLAEWLALVGFGHSDSSVRHG